VRVPEQDPGRRHVEQLDAARGQPVQQVDDVEVLDEESALRRSWPDASFAGHDHVRRNLAEGALIARARKRCLRDDGSGEGRMGPFLRCPYGPSGLFEEYAGFTEDFSRTGFQARVVFGD
jgi:hypothetical protein